jgi:D-alanine--poly(phosphoribitol) ligase subunit 1
MDTLERFLRICQEYPLHPAVVEGARVYRYADMERLVWHWAGAIAAPGLPHPRVLIQLPQGAHAYAAMFATLAAGGYYAPGNTAVPAARQLRLATEFAPDVVITTPASMAILAGQALPSVRQWIDATQEIGSSSTWYPPLDAPRAPHALAYVMFTSGSTGIPKGVMVPRTGVAHYITWALRAMQVTGNDRWSQHPNIAFDLSVLDIYGALCGGATLYPLVTPKERMLPAQVIRQRELTIWNSVPSVIDLMAQGHQLTSGHLRSLRLMSFCGEPLLLHHVTPLFAARPDLRIHNTYGPTEATVSCTLAVFDADTVRQDTVASAGQGLPLGDPIEGMELYLAGDGDSTPSAGELVIAGPQLAHGYWNNPQQTAAAFRDFTTPDGRSVRAYFTGDWCERRGQQLYFRQRIDQQVKLHGYRLELDEVAHALRTCGFQNAVCAVINGELHAFVEGATPSPDTVTDVQQRLATILPTYAIPKRLHGVPQFPRNANDKTDTAALVALLMRSD